MKPRYMFFDIPRWDIQEDESGENNSTRLLKYSESQRKANPPRRVANIMALCSAGGWVRSGPARQSPRPAGSDPGRHADPEGAPGDHVWAAPDLPQEDPGET